MNYEWSFEEEAQLKCDALEIAKKKDLNWDEDLNHRLSVMLQEIERDDETTDRDLMIVTSLQVDEVRQSLQMLTSTKSQTQDLSKGFDDLGTLIHQERVDMKDFKVLKELHQTLETLTAVTTTARTLLSLQKRHAEIEEELAKPGAAVFPICEELKPVHSFKQDLQKQSGNASNTHRFSQHFELLAGVIDTVVARIRQAFTQFAQKGCAIDQLEQDGGSWEGLLDEQFRTFDDILQVVRRDQLSVLLTEDLSHFREDERDVVSKDGLWGVILFWIRQSMHNLWYSTLGVNGADCEGGAVDSNDPKTMLAKLTKWVKSVLGIIFNLVKDGQDLKGQVLEGTPWKTMDIATDIIKVLVDVGHEMVMKVLHIYVDRVSRPDNPLGAQNLLAIVKWTKVYDTPKGICSCIDGIDFSKDPNPPRIATPAGVQDISDLRSLLLRHTAQTLKEWLADTATGMAKTICELVYKKKEEIEAGNAQRLQTMGPVDFFDLLTTQVTEIGYYKDTSSIESLATGIQMATKCYVNGITESCSVEWWEMETRLGSITGELASDEHRLRVLCAFANDMTRCAEEVVKVEKQFLELLPSERQGVLHFEMVVTDFQEATTVAVQQINHLVMHTCQKSWPKVFDYLDEQRGPDDDTRENTFLDVICTIEDYERDLQTWLHPEPYHQVFYSLLRFVEIEYLQHFVEWLKGMCHVFYISASKEMLDEAVRQRTEVIPSQVL
ncbi:hypothetical protein DIPPA_28023 [Diplonema papillatum]|nr:hypothetical protein DIPPA_28023 [Diplonema papillatum]